MLPAVRAEKSSQYRCRQVEWDVADDGGPLERLVKSVGGACVDAGKAGPQPGHPVFIDVDSPQRSPEASEMGGQCTVTGADLQNWAGRLRDERGQALERRVMDEEVLAEFVSAARVGSRSQESAPE